MSYFLCENSFYEYLEILIYEWASPSLSMTFRVYIECISVERPHHFGIPSARMFKKGLAWTKLKLPRIHNLCKSLFSKLINNVCETTRERVGQLGA